MLREQKAVVEKSRETIEGRLASADDALTRLQSAHVELRSASDRELAEQRANGKLKDMEIERLRLTVEQAAARERKLLDENGLLDQKGELLRTECRDTERKAQEDLLQDRAELYALRRRVEYYESMETDLDSAIQKVAEGDLGTADDASLALGAVLATTPTASSRRLQESLTLARTLYKRQRELAAAEERISKLEKHLEHARVEAQAADEARAVASQPQEYLIESIRDKEREIQFLKRRVDALDKELAAVRRE